MTTISRGFNGQYDRRGNKLRGVSQQNWTIGAVVRIGFVDGLKVMGQIDKGFFPGANSNKWLLNKGEAYYLFEPHYGLQRLHSRQEWLDATRWLIMTVQQ